DSTEDITPVPEGAGDATYSQVYAHTDTELYRIDPETLAVTKVAPFKFPMGADQMTDIALDRNGKMIGTSFTRVYSIDAKTAECTFLSNLQKGFNGLTFIPAKEIDPGASSSAPEVLV